MIRLTKLLLLFILPLLYACTQKEKEVRVESVTISQSSVEIEIGKTLQLSATVYPSTATRKDVTWSSTKSSVASVSSSGLVTAASEGTTTITASADGKKGECTVSVEKGFVAVSEVRLNRTELTLNIGEENRLIATVLPEDATNKTLSWTSYSPHVATVDEKGLIKGLSVGKARIFVSTNNPIISASCFVTITEPVIEFEDPLVALKCIAHWDTNGDHFLSFKEAESVESLGSVFNENGESSHIEKFNELRFFTGLKRIEEKAFYYCVNLNEITLPNSIESIGEMAFYANVNLEHLTIPNTVCSIESGAFGDCRRLREIELPKGLKRIEKETFVRCQSMESISFLCDELEMIEKRSFLQCVSLTSISLPDSVKEIGDEAFSNCINLKTVCFPESLEQMGDKVFWLCNRLEKLSGKNTSEDGRCYVLNGELKGFAQEGLTSYSLPVGIRKITSEFFYSCSMLTSIALPKSIEQIGGYAFHHCDMLTTVYCYANRPPKVETPIDLSSVPLSNLYVPDESVDTYKIDDGWKWYADYIRPISEL